MDSLSDQMGAVSKSAITDEDMAFLIGMAGYNSPGPNPRYSRAAVALWLIGYGYFKIIKENLLYTDPQTQKADMQKAVEAFENEIMRIEPTDDERLAAYRVEHDDTEAFASFVFHVQGNVCKSRPAIFFDSFTADPDDVRLACGFLIRHAQAERLLDIFSKIRKDLGMGERKITIETQHEALQKLVSTVGLEDQLRKEEWRGQAVIVLDDFRK